MTTGFEHRRVLVTGAASGIGRRVAERFLAEGAEVIGLDLRTSAAPFRLLPVDLGDPDQVADTCASLRAERAGLDVLVNAAGTLRTGDAETLSLEDWRTSLDVNVSGVFYLMREWIPQFKAQGAGNIVSIASNAAQTPRMGMAAYGASKAALASLSHCVGLELAPFGVRCNLVSPGSTDTPMLRGLWQTAEDRERTLNGSPRHYRLGIPLGKLATVDDIAAAVLFLASDQAAHITLQNLVIDGGATLGA